jgi:hypothetical protein
MPDLKQSLRDFVATSNSGKYDDEQVLLSKFPELQGYDIQLLRDFVATSNSGKYTDEEELFSKFSEFNYEASELTPKKKEESTESGLDVSLSGSLSGRIFKPTTEVIGQPEQPIQPSLEDNGRKKLKQFEESQKYDRYGMPISTFPEVQREEVFTKPKQEAETKVKYEERKQELEKKVPGFLKPSVETIDKNFLSRKPSFVVDDLNRQYKESGFNFSGSDFYENVKVTAPNGKTLSMSTNAYLNNVEDEAERLKFFIKENSPSIGTEQIDRLQKEYDKGNQNFLTQKQLDEQTKQYNESAELLKKEIQDFLPETNAIQALKNQIESYPESQKNSPEYKSLVDNYNIKLGEYNVKSKALKTKIENSKQNEDNLKRSAGEYIKYKAQQGGLMGSVWNRANDVIGGIFAEMYNGFIDFNVSRLGNVSGLLPEKEFQELYNKKLKEKGYSEGQKISEEERKSLINEIDYEMRDKIAKGFKYGKAGEEKLFDINPTQNLRDFFREKFGTLNTTEEYIKRIEEEGNLLQRGIIGVGSSIPAMIGPPLFRYVSMYNMIANGVRQEMESDPDFDNISEAEKQMTLVPISIIGTELEKLGLSNLFKGKSIIGDITKRVLGKVPVGATASQIRSTALYEIKEMGLRGSLALTGSMLAEAETGALQQASDYLVKDIYNTMKGKKMFDTPIAFSYEYFKNIGDAALVEGIGSAPLAIPTAIHTAFTKDGFQGLNDDTFKMFEELSKMSDSKKFFVIDLKNKINEGKITKAEADNILEVYDKSAGLVQQIPDEITDVNERKKAMDLLKERKRLEDKTQGKDPALTKPIQNQINNINEQLNAITENAIQKQAAGEASIGKEAEGETKIPDEILSLNDDEQVTFTVKSLDEIPEEFRDRASKKEGVEVEVRNTILGLPIGPKKTKVIGEAYTYSLTGKEAKDYAIQKQAADEVSVQPETGTGEEVVQGEPQPKPEVTPEQGVLSPEESQRKEKLANALRYTEPGDGYRIVVDGTPMEIIDAQAELDALLEKEQAAPETQKETKEEEVILEVTEEQVVTEEKTPEQEADFLEELVKRGKAPVEEKPIAEEPITKEEPIIETKEEAKVEEALPEKKPEPEVYVPKDENIGSKEYRTKAPKHVTGRARERTIADGTKIRGRYKLVSADEVLASHSEETFGKTEGFPINEQGKTVNDRDYETDKAAQSEVIRIAGKLDERAISQTPIVTKDGIVVDGNNRTMSRKLAAKQGTDASYIEALKQDADMYGIDPNEIDNVKNPMLVFEAEQEIPYTTKEFSRFNKAEKKEKSPIEKAVELSKTVTDRFRRMLGSIYDKAKNPSDVTSNASTMSDIRDLLLAEGILQPNELPRYINPETGTATKEGVAFLETLLIGSALSENAIRTLDNEGMGNAKRRIVESVVQITKNAGLGVNSLQKNIENGIKLLGKAIATNQSVTDVIRQMDLFEISEFSAEDLAIGVLLDGDGFKKFLQKYNSEVGTEGFFGSITKEGLIDELLNNKIKGYEQIRKNLRSDVEAGKTKVQANDGGVKPKDKGEQGVTGKGKEQGEKLSNKVRNLKIKGPDGLQSNIFGVPIAIWNAAVETVASAIDAGVAIAEAVQRGIKEINDKHGKKWNKNNAEAKFLNSAYANAIQLARENGISDKGIETYLKKKGLNDAQIKTLIKEKPKAEKKPISKERIIRKPKPKKVTVNEMTALKDQIKLEARAAREAKGDLNAKRKMLAAAINEMAKKGAISVRQANAIIKRVNFVNLDNPIMVDRLLNYVGNILNDADYDTKMQDIRNLQNQVKRKKHPSMQSSVKEFISINPELIPDDRILDYIQALDDMNTLTPSYIKMNDIFNEMVSYKTEPKEFDAINTFQKLMDKLESIALNQVKSVEDYVNLIRDINAFKRKANQLLQNGDITQEQYDKAIENIGKDQDAVEKKYEKEIKQIKENLIAEIESLRPSTNSEFTPEENALITKYLEIGKGNLMQLSPEQLYVLNDLLQNMKEGEFDYYRFNDIVSKAYTKDGIEQTAAQLDKSNFNMAEDEGKRKMSEFESAFWEGVLGLGRVTSGALEKHILAPFKRAISSYEKFLQDSYNQFNKIKNKYGMKDQNMNRLGVLTTYLQEYMAQFDPENKGIQNIGKRDWFKEILGDKSMKNKYPTEKLTFKRLAGKIIGRGQSETEMIQKIWDSLPKDADGNVDPKAVYDSYMANDGKYFSKKEKAFFDEIMEWKQKNTTTKQKAANELRGNPFKEIPFHMLRARYGEDKKQISASVSNGMIRIEAGTGKERTSEKVGPINTNFEEMFINGVEQTARDYYLSPAIQDINNTMSGVSAKVGKDKQTLVNVITGGLSEALNFEFSKTESFVVFKSLLAARATEVLLDPERTVRELLSGLASYPLRAKTLSGYKDLFRGVRKMKELLEFTESPIRLRNNIGTALDISDGKIKKMNSIQKATLYLAGLPERTMMVTSWMPTFMSEFKAATGVKFNMESFKTDQAYREKYGKDIKNAAAVADAQTEKIIGTTVKAGQRREIRIAPEFLANLIGKRGTVSKNTAYGQIFGFFTNYPYREVTEFFNGFREAAEVIRNEGVSKTLKALSQLSKPIGVATNVAVYGYLASISYPLMLMLLGDDDDEERGKQMFEEMTTRKGIVEDFEGNAINLLASKYGFGAKILFQTAGTLAYINAEDPEEKQWIKKFMKGSMYVDPFPIEGLTKYGGKEKGLASIAANVPQFVMMINRATDLVEASGDIKKLYDKVEEKGIEALTNDEQGQVLAITSLIKTVQTSLNLAGNSLPMYNKLKIYMKKLRTESGVTEKTSATKKREAYGGFKTIEELKIADPKKYKELSKEGGALYELRKENKEKNKISEEKKEKYYKEEYGVSPKKDSKSGRGGSREGRSSSREGEGRGGGR